MSDLALTKMSKKPIAPSKVVQPSKPIELAGNNSMVPGNLGNGQVQGILIGLRLTPEQAANLPTVQISQQSITINVQQNVTINNYNSSSQEPPKQGSHEGSRDRFVQGLQQATPRSRIIQDTRPCSGNTVPSRLTSTHTSTPHTKSQNGTGGGSNNSQCAPTQARQNQGIPNSESISARTTSPAHSPATSRPRYEGSRNSTPTNVSAAPVHGQVHGQKARSEGNKHIGIFERILHSNSDRGNSSKKRAHLPNSTALSSARGSSSNHPNGSRESPVVRKSQNHGDAKPPCRQSQAPSESATDLVPGSQILGPSHGNPQSRGHDGVAGTPQVQSAVDQRARVAPEIATSLKKEDILKHLGKLKNLLADVEMKTTNGSPVRLILIGKSAAEMMGLVDRDEAYHLDVILDLAADDPRRSCMKHDDIFKVFREFDMPPHRAASTWESFFGKGEQARATKLKRIIEQESEKTIFNNNAHLQVYIMKDSRALRFELDRMARMDPATDKQVRRASGSIVVSLLWREMGKRGSKTYEDWPRHVSSDLKSEVRGLFKERYGERGTV